MVTENHYAIIPRVGNKKLQGIIQVVISLGLLALLVYQVGPAAILSTFAEISLTWYALALLLFMGNIVLRAYRWYLLLHALDERPSFLYLTYLYFVGFFFNNFIPTGFGGDVVKVLGVRQTYGRGIDALSSVIMERLTGLLGSSLIALLALTWNALVSPAHLEVPAPLLLMTFMVSIGIMAGFIILRWAQPLDWLARSMPFTRPITANQKVLRLADTVRRYPISELWRALLISIPFTISLIFVQYAVARALHVDVSWPLFALFVPIIALVNLLPISFNGLGTREGVYLLLFVPAGIPSEQAIAMSLAYYGLRIIAGLLGGAMLAVRSLSNVARTAAVRESPRT